MQFVDEHLRMEDGRLYLKDLLIEYHNLQRSAPSRKQGFIRLRQTCK